jgi:glycosyltransferase involved in cell wall biosynthesis
MERKMDAKIQQQNLILDIPSIRRNFTVSLIIPTLDEAENLPLVFAYIPFDWVDEVILVDGRSNDNTVEVARSLLPEIKVVLETQPGKGAAMQAGYEAATGDILIVMDADGSNDPREIPRFIHALLQGADFAKGSRFAPQGGTTDMERLRQFGNWGFVKLSNLLFAAQFTDLLYGYHAFWRYCLDSITLKGMNGFEIDTALYLRAVRAKLRIVDVPSFEGYRFHGDGKLKTFPDGWRVLKTIMREWIDSLRTDNKETYKGFRSFLPNFRDTSVRRALLRQRRLEQQAKLLMKSGGPMLQNVLQLLQHSIQQLPVDSSYLKLLPELLLLTMKSLRASGGTITLFNEQGHVQAGYTMQNGKLRTMSARKTESTVTDGLAGWVKENQQPAVVDDTLEDPRWLNRDWELHKGSTRSALGLPLVDGDRVIGVLTLTREDEPFSDAELDLNNLDISDLAREHRAKEMAEGRGNGFK